MTLTPKQEKFAQKYIELGNASEAYRQSYDADNMLTKTINEEASRVLADPKVSARVRELKTIHLKNHEFTVADAIREYDEARILAGAEKQASPMISATKAKCELLGLEAPKTVNIEGSFGEWLMSVQGRKGD